MRPFPYDGRYLNLSAERRAKGYFEKNVILASPTP